MSDYNEMMSQVKKRRLHDYQSKCVNELCENISQHISGLCRDCRKRQCKRAGCNNITTMTLKSSGYCAKHAWAGQAEKRNL